MPSGLKKNRIRMLKSQNDFNKMELNGNTIYQVYIIDKHANRLDSLENMYVADFGTAYIGKNSVEVSTGSDEIKTTPFQCLQLMLTMKFQKTLLSMFPLNNKPT